MKLLFDQARVPRTTTRAEWREMHRWCRTAARRLSVEEDRLRGAMADMPADLALGAAHILIDPPLLLGPHQ